MMEDAMISSGMTIQFVSETEIPDEELGPAIAIIDGLKEEIRSRLRCIAPAGWRLDIVDEDEKHHAPGGAGGRNDD